jgi:hypothetical protein
VHSIFDAVDLSLFAMATTWVFTDLLILNDPGANCLMTALKFKGLGCATGGTTTGLTIGGSGITIAEDSEGSMEGGTTGTTTAGAISCGREGGTTGLIESTDAIGTYAPDTTLFGLDPCEFIAVTVNV